MNSIKTDKILDAKGLACPMPIVKTKKVISEMEAGQILAILATDKGSTADLKAWSERLGHHYLGTREEGVVLKHYVRKSTSEEAVEKTYPHIVSNEELKNMMNDGSAVIVDVREEAEYAFNHLEGALSIPLGELENRLHDLNKEDEIYVICRTGNRSDMAAQKLVENGFVNVKNVVPGMGAWSEQEEK
ncbi:sulfurtransferase TusA family protein [Bacillus sp. FSL K6-3431]|uniref:sulfurtransferase TusA family protein n=1 Tax=Bacillus sp. FSL K6-3431 TaxID=2921500 RepID=UPI0030F72BCE